MKERRSLSHSPAPTDVIAAAMRRARDELKLTKDYDIAIVVRTALEAQYRLSRRPDHIKNLCQEVVTAPADGSAHDLASEILATIDLNE